MLTPRHWLFLNTSIRLQQISISRGPCRPPSMAELVSRSSRCDTSMLLL